MNGISKGILALAITVFIVLFSSIIFSDSNPFQTPRTCSSMWGGDCDNSDLDDSNPPCNGTNWPYIAIPNVKEVYINASSVFFGDAINVTCYFDEDEGGTNYLYIWYYNNSNWVELYNNSSTANQNINRSVIFKPNSSEGPHIVRCIHSFAIEISGECANNSYGGVSYDNDDVNFTVTSHLTYNFWNLTNYTNGSEIADNQTFNRNTSINVSAHWSKTIDFAQIEHNGTGSWVNYTVCSLPNCIGNWTNYTLNLSNSTEFNVTTIAIRSIYANDTYSATNNTSTLLYFNLSAGNAPNVTNFWFNYSNIRTNQSNKYTNLTIYANASDDVGLNTVAANITYPDGNSTNVTMNGSSCYSPNWCLWNYTFGNDLHLNSTGNYTVRIIAYDIGNQNKSSGTDSPLENMNFTVYSNYTLNLTSNYTIFNRGENLTIQSLDVNNLTVETVNWVANVTKINQTYNFTPQQTTFNYTVLPNDTEGNYSIIVNASKDNNTGNSSWNFDVSRNLSLTISTDTALSPGNTLNISVNLTNARGELYNSSVSANITCPNGMKSLSFSSGRASTLECTATNSYSTAFNITVNATDNYNNTGENYTTFTTTAAPSSGASGGGGGFATETKKCSDKTLYSQCSSQRPLYCSNGTLVNKCSVCGCNNTDYGCQPDGSCTLVKKDDFNFEANITSIELRQGEDKEFVIGILKNTGNTILNLRTFLDVPPDCCNISLPSTIELKEREEKEFNLSIHVPLTSNVSEYLVKIGIGTSSFRKERSFSVMITKSPYYDSLAEIEAELLSIEKEILEYRKAGVNVDSLENKLEEAKSKLYIANSSIINDQINVLTGYISEISGDVKYVQSGLSSIRTQMFFSQLFWLVLMLIISSLVTIYAVPEVLMPLYKTEKEIRKLKDEEKILVSSRVETEKQYFMRKIDENTFSKIMIGKQDKILKTRATIKEMEDKTKQIVETRLKPRGIGNTIKEKINKVFKKKDKN